MKKIILFIIFMLCISCNTFTPKYKNKIQGENIHINYYDTILTAKVDSRPIYSYSCHGLYNDGVFYSTEEHDKLVEKMKTCVEATVGSIKYDDSGKKLIDKDGNIIRNKSHMEVIYDKYDTLLLNSNSTIDDYNILVDEYYKIEDDKKFWFYTTGGLSGSVILLITLIILL